VFWDNFTFYCTKSGTSPNAVGKKLGFSSGSITAWKNGTVPRSSAVVKIANYFGINVEDLIEQKEKAAPITEDGLSEKEIEFFKKVDLLNPAMQRLSLACSVLDEEEIEHLANVAEMLAKAKGRL
jgi:transcriptional regulator with XRE-family HTH domain